MIPYQFLALPIIAFPLILITGIVLIPVVSNYADHDLAEKAAQQTKLWFWSHLISGIAFGTGLLALFFYFAFLIGAANPPLANFISPLCCYWGSFTRIWHGS